MKLNLVKEGIFPILFDKNGDKLNNVPDTGYQTPGTVQGEGKLTGIPVLFVRTSTCNLRCMWKDENGHINKCDTPYSSFDAETNHVDVNDIISIIENNARMIKHVVVSGGEPTIQKRPLAELLSMLQSNGFHTTIETNGTLYDSDISKYTNLVSFSPKLSNSTPTIDKDPTIGEWSKLHDKRRINIDAIQKYINDCYVQNVNGLKQLTMVRQPNKDFQLKFVVNQKSDIDEIKRDFLQHLYYVNPDDVLLMPEGILPEEINAKSKWIIEACIENGWRFSTRLHSLVFGTKRGI